MTTETTPGPIEFTSEELAQIDELVAAGSSRPAIFKRLAEERGETSGRISAAYYRAKRAAGQEAPDGPDEATTDNAEPAGEDGELFPATNYDDPHLKLDTPDGARVDAIAINFGGDSSLDRSDVDDVALIRSLELGRKGTLTIRFEVDSIGYGHRRRQDRTETVNKVKLGLGEIVNLELDAE